MEPGTSRPRPAYCAAHAKPGARRLPLAEAARPIDRHLRPIYAVWEITLACDLACRHCGSRAGRGRPDELTTAEALDLIDQMARLDVKEVTVIGGEAYLREDWLDLVRALRGHKIPVTMTSGGRGLTPELVEQAKAAGLRGVSISIDGDEATHDRLRGVAGSYRSAIAAMRAVKASGMALSCNTQINRLSMPLLEEILETVAALGIRGWQIQLTVPMGRAADEPEILLQPYDLLDLFPRLAALKKRCDELKVVLWPGNNIGYFGPYESIIRGSIISAGHGGSCGAGRDDSGYRSERRDQGLSVASDRGAGRAATSRDDSLEAIWEREPSRCAICAIALCDDLWGYCRTCYYAEDCMAGCTWTSFVTLGRAGNNPFCHHRAIEMAKDGKRERIVKVTEAPGEPFDHGAFEIVVDSFGGKVQRRRRHLWREGVPGVRSTTPE